MARIKQSTEMTLVSSLFSVSAVRIVVGYYGKASQEGGHHWRWRYRAGAAQESARCLQSAGGGAQPGRCCIRDQIRSGRCMVRPLVMFVLGAMVDRAPNK